MKKRILQSAVAMLLSVTMAFGISACSGSKGAAYKISFDSDGGSFVAPVTYTVGQNMRMPNPTKYGHKFDGWYYPDGTKFVSDGSDIGSAVTLKAKWSIGEYTITFDTDDLMDVAPLIAKYGDPIELPELPDFSGCAFQGWFKDDLSTRFTADTMPGENITVYALWDAGMTSATGTVKMDSDGNCYTIMGRTLAVFNEQRISAGEYSIDVDYGNIKGVSGNNFGLIFALTEPSSASYWETGLGLSYYYFHIAIDSGNIQLAKVRGDHTLKYESKQIVQLENNTTDWKQKFSSDDNISTFGVRWNNGSINCYIDGELQISCNDTSPILFGNKIGVRNVGAGLVFESEPILDPIYCARFDTDGAGTISPLVADSSGRITLPDAPAKEGYDFDRWKTLDGEDYVDFNANTPLKGDVQLKAFYTPKNYQIKLHRYLESPEATDEDGTIEQAYRSSITLPVPTREGKTFEGWYLSDMLTPANIDAMPLGGLDVYAKWSDDHVVTFDRDNGQKLYAQFVRENGVATLPQEDPVKYGHIFEQWNSGEASYDFTTPVTDDLTIRAAYSKGTYTLTFYALNGNPSAVYQTETAEYGTALDVPDPQKDGWVFAGWYAENLMTKVDATAMVGEDMKLYARYNLDGGPDVHDIRGTFIKETDSEGKIVYRAGSGTSVALLDGVAFTSGCISVEYNFSSWSPRAGFMFCADIPDGSLDSNWEMATGVTYYTFNLNMTTGALGMGKVQGASYTTLTAVYIDSNQTSYADKYLSNAASTKMVATVTLERVGSTLKITFYIDGEKQLEYTDTAPLSGTAVGLSAYNINTKFSDFYIIDTSNQGNKQ